MQDLGFDTKKLQIIEDKPPLFIQSMFKPLLMNFSLASWTPKEILKHFWGKISGGSDLVEMLDFFN